MLLAPGQEKLGEEQEGERHDATGNIISDIQQEKTSFYKKILFRRVARTGAHGQ